MFERSRVRVPAGAAGFFFFFFFFLFCADSYFRTAVALKDPGRSAKSAGSRLQLNTHAPYACGFARSDMVHGCMVYTKLAETAAVLLGTCHVSAESTPLRWVFKNAL